MTERIVHTMYQVRPFALDNVDMYKSDLYNISEAFVGRFDYIDTNIFFQESCVLINNAIDLFHKGYFDVAFYSLRQSIETSVNSLYIATDSNVMKEWNKLCDGYELKDVLKELNKEGSLYSELRKKLNVFFSKLKSIKRISNKYVHKQGLKTFYSQQFNIEQSLRDSIVEDFESMLSISIAAVAVHRLIVDPLPVLFMDEDIVYRSGDLMTEPFSEEFVDKYLGRELIDLYKETEFFKSYRTFFLNQEVQNEDVFNIIHYQYYRRDKYENVQKQIHLLSMIDRLAVSIFLVSDKIPQIFVEGFYYYTSDVESINGNSVTFGLHYFDTFFGDEDYNVTFKESFMSRVLINKSYTYVEHNQPLSEVEIEMLKYVSDLFCKNIEEHELELKQWMADNGVDSAC